MAKSFACKDIGMDCNFRARANNEEDIYKKVGDHAKKVHNIQQMDRDLMAKIGAAIKEVV
jgi:predicted small metal-binding protein